MLGLCDDIINIFKIYNFISCLYRFLFLESRFTFSYTQMPLCLSDHRSRHPIFHLFFSFSCSSGSQCFQVGLNCIELK